MRALIDFWIVAFVVVFASIGVLHSLGAPERPAASVQSVGAAPLETSSRASARSVRIASPDPALIEPSRLLPNVLLPRRADDGRIPMRAYARPFDTSDSRPRIGLLVAGLGVLEEESRAAVRTLPGPVSFAVSTYGQKLGPLLQAARDTGHELLASIPMEAAGFPLNDAGARSLLTNASQEANQRNLEAVLGRFAGYVGATGASDGMRGERFMQSASSFGRVADELTSRGLLYIDPRPATQGVAPINAPALPLRAVDVVVDDPASRTEIEAKLAQLERVARDRGSALGLASAMRPDTLDLLAAWARSLEARNFVLAPISALVLPVSLPGRPR